MLIRHWLPLCVHSYALRSTALQEEEVEKSCEGCCGANVAHRLRHTLRRLPRVLVLHMKRFKASFKAPAA